MTFTKLPSKHTSSVFRGRCDIYLKLHWWRGIFFSSCLCGYTYCPAVSEATCKECSPKRKVTPMHKACKEGPRAKLINKSKVRDEPGLCHAYAGICAQPVEPAGSGLQSGQWRRTLNF